MPIYEYQCDACGHNFEARQKFSDAPLSECPACQGAVKKLISRTGFTLKGGGWYEQGYNASKAPACDSAGSAPGSSGGCAGCPKAANE